MPHGVVYAIVTPRDMRHDLLIRRDTMLHMRENAPYYMLLLLLRVSERVKRRERERTWRGERSGRR